MKLFTNISIPQGNRISYDSSILSIGSCFATNIGNKLKEGKFNIDSNPFGILYNPASICQALSRAIENRFFSEDELIEKNGLWHSWMHHGSFSGTDKLEVLSNINQSLEQTHSKLKTVDFLTITLGSAYTYALRNNGFIVANCHKFPNSEFVKNRLTIEDIQLSFNQLFQQLKAFNPEIKIIFTVSPVRHIRDGILESQRSKAVLLLATEFLCEMENVSYFPSYEIMMDELRDYRFYNADMIHPNDVAIQYIWEKFRETHFDSSTENHYQKILKIAKGFQHKILHPNTKEHQQFLYKQVEKAEKIMKEVTVDFSSEINQFKGQLQLFKD